MDVGVGLCVCAGCAREIGEGNMERERGAHGEIVHESGGK